MNQTLATDQSFSQSRSPEHRLAAIPASVDGVRRPHRGGLARFGGPSYWARALLVFLFCLTFAGFAAADDYAYSASHQTKKSPDHVFDVLTAYQEVCDEGCKYYGPDVVKFLRVQERRTDTKWYTWTYVKTGLKKTMYFSEVTVSRRSKDGFVFTTRLLGEQDKDVVAFLTERTGLEHNPVFYFGETTITVKRQGDVTHVTQSMKMSATGMVTMFPKRIEAGMKQGAQATFDNIEK